VELKKIIEEYKDSFKEPVFKRLVEIFANPSRKEMNEVSKEIKGKKYIRFIAKSSNKTFYVFRPDVFHYEVAKRVHSKSKNDLWGSAMRVGGHWIFDGADLPKMDKKSYEGTVKKDWSWLKKFMFFNKNLIGERYSVYIELPDEDK